MRMTRSGNFWIIPIVQTTIWKLRLVSADLATVLATRQLQNTYQELYHWFYQQPSHHHEGMDRDGRSTHLEEDEEETMAAYLKADEAVLGVFKESVEEEAN